MTDAQLGQSVAGTPSFTYNFTTTATPGPFTIGLYRSADTTFDRSDELVGQDAVTPSPTNPQAPRLFTFAAPFEYDPARPYLLAVADPGNAIHESDEQNNVAFVLLPVPPSDPTPPVNPPEPPTPPGDPTNPTDPSDPTKPTDPTGPTDPPGNPPPTPIVPPGTNPDGVQVGGGSSNKTLAQKVLDALKGFKAQTGDLARGFLDSAKKLLEALKDHPSDVAADFADAIGNILKDLNDLAPLIGSTDPKVQRYIDLKLPGSRILQKRLDKAHNRLGKIIDEHLRALEDDVQEIGDLYSKGDFEGVGRKIADLTVPPAATVLVGGIAGKAVNRVRQTLSKAEQAAANGLARAERKAAKEAADRAEVGVHGPGRFLTPGEFAQLPRSGTIDPGKIRFSQDSIKGAFSKGGDIAQLAADLKAGRVDPSSIPPIRIVEREGNIFTLDNRRLQTFQEAGLPIRYEKLDSVPRRELFKFTTTNDGTSIKIRGRR